MTKCNESGCQYGLWSVDEKLNICFRKCIKCSNIEELPLTKEILNEIKKQKIAKHYLNHWIEKKTDDYYLSSLGGVYVIFSEYLSYFGKEEKESIFNKLNEISLSPNNSMINLEYLNYFKMHIRNYCYDDEFYDVLDKFYDENREDFLPLSQTEKAKRSM